MSLLEELTEKYSVLDVPSYGKCVIIPAKDFISDLKKMLEESGVKFFRSHMGGPVIQIPLDDLKGIKGMKAAVPEPSETLDTSDTPNTSDTPSKRPHWSDSEDKFLIELRKSGRKEEDWVKDFVKRFPNRTPAAAHNRISRLIQTGKIKPLLGTRKKQSEPQAISRPDIRTSNEPQAKSLSNVAEKSPTATPFTISTTLTVQIIVNCNDRKSVENFIEVTKGLSTMLRGG